MASWVVVADSGGFELEDQQPRERTAAAALLRLAALALVLGFVVAVFTWLVLRQADDAWCAADVYRRGVVVEGEASRDWRSSDQLTKKQRSEVRCEPGREPYLVE